MTAGTQDRKKLAILGALLAIAVVVFYMNSSSSPEPIPAANGPHATVPLVAPHRNTAAEPPAANTVRRAGSNQRTLQEFRPSLKPKKPEERPDPLTVDPGLRLDVLGKLQHVNLEGEHRSIFDFSQPPAPKPAASDAKKPPVPSPLLAEQQAQQQQGPPQPPPPPPIPLKFYGYMTARSQSGPKRAFFLDGEDIQVVNEGDVIKRRYKVVRIGVNSVVVEDLDAKNQQTLPLEAAPAG